MKKAEVIGEIYGNLTVIASEQDRVLKSGKKASQWLCECSCGKEITVLLSWLRSKRWPKLSCGCQNYLNPRKVKDPKLSSYKALYNRYWQTAKRRKIDFSISLEEAIKLFSGNCFYCGIEAKQFFNVYKTKGGVVKTKTSSLGDNASIYMNGIDRIDSNEGYKNINVVSCCTICNFAKNALSTESFLNWLDRISKYQGYKK